MALSNSDRQRRLRQKRAERGLVAMTVYARACSRDSVLRVVRAFDQYDVNGIVVRSRKTGRVATIPLDEFPLEI